MLAIPVYSNDTGAFVIESRAIAEATVIPALVTAFMTSGYYNAGDGGQALYINGVATTPGGFTDAGGREWVLAEQPLNVKMYGAKGDGATDDAASIQAAVNALMVYGGELLFPEANYVIHSTITVNRTYSVSAPHNGQHNLLITGYGAQIETVGDIYAFTFIGGWVPNRNCTIAGFTVYHRGNTTALGAFRSYGASLVNYVENSVVVSNTLPATYAAFRLENSNPAVDATGSFWNTIRGCVIRPWDGAEGYCAYGVDVVGEANALIISECSFGGTTTGVRITPSAGYTTAANATVIDNNWFEGPTTAIQLVSTAAGYHVTGTRITNNRFEAITTILELTGVATLAASPTVMAHNFVSPGIPNYIVNPQSVPIVKIDSYLSGDSLPPMSFPSFRGSEFTSSDNAYNPVTAIVPNLGVGYKLARYDGIDLGLWKYAVVAGGVGSVLGGTLSPNYRPFAIVACFGISSNDTVRANFTGTATFAASTTAVVTFPVVEPDANYNINLDLPSSDKFWVTNKTVNGFTINCSVVTSETVGWTLIGR